MKVEFTGGSRCMDLELCMLQTVHNWLFIEQWEWCMLLGDFLSVCSCSLNLSLLYLTLPTPLLPSLDNLICSP